MTGDPQNTRDGETPASNLRQESRTPPHDAQTPAHDDAWHAPRIWPRVVGVLILLVGVSAAWLWQNPGFIQGLLPHAAPNDDSALKALEARVAQLEQRPPPPDIGPLTARVEALEKRGPQVGQLAADPRPLIARLDALEARSVPAAQSPDLRSLAARLDALEKTVAERPAEPPSEPKDTAAIETRLDDLDREVSGLTAKGAGATESADSAVRLAKLSSTSLALAAGQPLGAIPDAPAALTRFATVAPPTEPGLRLAFPGAMKEALKVSLPDTEGKPFLDRMLARLQDFRLITVREGDHVVIGNQTADILAHAKTLLDTGDLAGAARTVATLSGPPAEKMAPWLADANALLAAREALAALARAG